MDPDKARVKPVWNHLTRTNHNFRHWRWEKEPQCLETKISMIHFYYNTLKMPKSRPWKPGKPTKNTQKIARISVRQAS